LPDESRPTGWSIDLLRSYGPQGIPQLDQVEVNSMVVAFTLIAILSTLLFALVPAFQMTRPDLNMVLQEGTAVARVGNRIVCAPPWLFRRWHSPSCYSRAPIC
jgi:hypothetical protein